MNLRKLFRVPLGLMLCLLLANCGGDNTNKDTNGVNGPIVQTNGQPVATSSGGTSSGGSSTSGSTSGTPLTVVSPEFDPTSTTKNFPVPLPNDLARNPQTGQNAITGTGEPFDAMNSLSGWSTAGPLFVPFTGAVDGNTITNQTVILIDTATQQPQPCTYEITDGDAGAASLVVATPVRPLSPNVLHIVVVTSGVLATNGQPVASNVPIQLTKLTTPLVDANGASTTVLLTDAQAQALEPVRQAYQPLWTAAEAATGTTRDNIPMVFAFTTQQLFQCLTTLRATAQAQNPTFTLIPGAQFVGGAAVTAFMNSTPEGQAILAAQPGFPVVVGAIRFMTIPAPNYIPNIGTPQATFFQGPANNPTNQGNNNIQVMVCESAVGAAPHPVLIFQHGLTRRKEDMLALAFGACGQGFTVVGIDIVDHGSRTITGLNPAPPPAGQSGTGFIDLTNLRLSRDNVRQTVADQMLLIRWMASGATDFDGNIVPNIAPNPPVGPVYAGQSLGGIIGGVMLPMETGLQFGVLNVPGGRLNLLLQNSAAISPQIVAGLAAAGVQQGTAQFRQFFWIAQTVVDDADPYNYAPHMFNGDLANNTAHSVLVQEMLNDQVVPNSATSDLAIAMGIDQVNAKQTITVSPPGAATITLVNQTSTNATPFNGNGLFQESGGGHGYLLDPSAGGPGGALTVHGQTQAGTFLFTHFIIPGATPIIPRAIVAGITQEWDFSSLVKHE